MIRVETPSCFDDLRARGPPHPARPSSGDVERGCVVLDLRELRNSDISIIGNSLFSDFRFLRAISRRARICDLREGACLPAPGAVPRGSGGPRPVTRVAGGVKFTCYMQLHVFTLKRPRSDRLLSASQAADYNSTPWTKALHIRKNGRSARSAPSAHALGPQCSCHALACTLVALSTCH